MRSLGVLCARGSSKRLARKHLQSLQGLPLVAWMCRAAAASTLTRVVMTTEDEEIARIAIENGVDVPFRRAAALSEDFASDFDIVVDALDRVEAQEGRRYDIVVMLQPTTPFAQPADIDSCTRRLVDDGDRAACFSVRPVTAPALWMFIERPDGRAQPLLDGVGSNAAAHKQLLPKCWFPSGAAYAVRTKSFREQKRVYATPYAIMPMPAERSVDIDEEVDLMIAESLARSKKFAPVPRVQRTRESERQKG
jgi:CMP-N-acetylneuraminic acid synthetase